MDWSKAGLAVSTYVTFHFAVLGFLSWVTGLGFLLPSLGPSIFLLATLPDDEMNFPQRIIGGQFIGTVAAFVSVRLLLGGHSLGEPIPPRSLLGLRQVLSTFVAATLTTAGMFVTDLEHPPAYATTLIISLGFMSGARQILIFMLAVLLVTAVHEALGKRGPLWDFPYERGT